MSAPNVKAPRQWTVQVPIVVTEEHVTSVIVSAYEAGYTYGMGYWCDKVNLAIGPLRLKEGESTAAALARNLLSGKTLKLHEHDDGDPVGDHFLTLGALVDAIAKWAVTWKDALTDKGTIDDLRFDGPASEYILQLAVFGEQRYG